MEKALGKWWQRSILDGWTKYTEYDEKNNKCKCDIRKEYYIAEVDLQYIPIKSYYNCLGEFLFLTREEAEKKLEEIKNGKK